MLQRLQLGFCEAGEEQWPAALDSVRTDVDGVKRGICQRCNRLVGVDKTGRVKSHKFQGKSA